MRLPFNINAPLGIFLLVVFSPALYFSYYSALNFLGYYVAEDSGVIARQAALEEAIKQKDVMICNRIIVPFGKMGGLAEYDLVNGCVNGYIHTVGDVSMCKLVISAADCVEVFAKERNDPDLCEKAYFATGNHGDSRGSCFGYFAGEEKDYRYCERLKRLPEFREGLLNECRHAYYDATGDASFYPEEIRKELEKE